MLSCRPVPHGPPVSQDPPVRLKGVAMLETVSNDEYTPNNQSLAQGFGFLEPDEVSFDMATRAIASSDVYGCGQTVEAVLRPRDVARCARALGAATEAGYTVMARGGGLSYTGGYLAQNSPAIVLDTSRLNRILEINAEDMYIRVEAGVTWKQIYDALAPLGLRLPFFGTFSGAQATVGGGLSNGALFLGTARYGTGADIVLGLEVARADGQIITTGQLAFRNASKPFYRTCGPDLTGLFLHESGAFGVKLTATLRLMRAPQAVAFGSFLFDGMAAAGRALSEVARSGAAEEAYVFDPQTTRKNLQSHGLLNDAGVLLKVMRSEKSVLKGLAAGARLVAAGRNFLPAEAFSLHVVCSGRSDAAVDADLAAIRDICVSRGGQEIADSIPRAVRADLFPAPDGVLGAEGDRWAALNAKVAHSDAERIMQAAAEVLAPYQARFAAEGVWMSHLLIAIGSHAFSFEPVFHWRDRWLPLHGHVLSEEAKAKLREPQANPRATALVHEARAKLVTLFAQMGAASNQLGKTYPYLSELQPVSAQFVKDLKHAVDPTRQVNRGALEL
jgi:FAD/FMN-containing dehydrogenase